MGWVAAGDQLPHGDNLRLPTAARAPVGPARLPAAAAERSRDVFGRLLPADRGRFARAWPAAARRTGEVDRVLCAAARGA